MALKGTSFEGGSAGTVTTSNPPTGGADTAFNQVPAFVGAGTAAVITTDSMHGTKSMEASQSSTVSSTAYALYNGYTATSAACRFYFKISTVAPSANIIIMRSFDNTPARWLAVSVLTTGKLRLTLTSADTTTYTGAVTLSANTWYRVEWSATLGNASNAVVNFQYYLGDSTSPVETGLAISNGNTGTGTSMSDFRYGIVAGSTTIATVRFDDVAQNDGTTTLIGPTVLNGTVTAPAATSSSAAVQPVITGDGVLTGGGAAASTSAAAAPAVTAGAVVTAPVSTSTSQAATPVVTGQSNITVSAVPATATVDITPPAVVGTAATYLFSPPQWRNVQMLGRSLRYGVMTSTVVYRQGGVWHNVQTAGIDAPVVNDVDVDATTGLRLFFSTPTPVPLSLVSEVSSALTPADPSWTPGTLTLA